MNPEAMEFDVAGVASDDDDEECPVLVEVSPAGICSPTAHLYLTSIFKTISCTIHMYTLSMNVTLLLSIQDTEQLFFIQDVRVAERNGREHCHVNKI